MFASGRCTRGILRPRRPESGQKLLKNAQTHSLSVRKVRNNYYTSPEVIWVISGPYHILVVVDQAGDKRVTNFCHGICHARQNRVILAVQSPMMTIPAADGLSTPIDSTTSIVRLFWDDLKAKSRVTKPCHDLSHICHVTNMTYEWIWHVEMFKYD